MSTTGTVRARQPRMPIEVRREQVLDAALRLIYKSGYEAVTMEAIALEADLAKPVIYNAYPGLGPLLTALLEREEARGLSELADAMPPHPIDAGKADLLLFWLRNLAGVIGENPGRWRLMLTPPAESPAVVREHVQAGRTFALGQVRSMTSSLLDQRPTFERVDRELAAQMVLAVAERAATLLIGDPEQFPPERLIEFAETVLQALQL